jgi:hypothetical protein
MGNLNYTLVPALCEPIDNSLQSTIPFDTRNIAVIVDREQGVSIPSSLRFTFYLAQFFNFYFLLFFGRILKSMTTDSA